MVRWGMLLGAILTIVLIAYGVHRFPVIWRNPADSALSLGAGMGMSMAYGLIGWFGPSLRGFGDARVLRHGVGSGLVAGVVFALSMLAEYLIPHGELANVRLAWTTFGLFFLILMFAGFRTTLETDRVARAPLAAVWTALIGSQVWFILLLSIYYAFLDTPQEARFLEVDQVIADFERHRASDLRTFIFEDYMGAGFFHSLLAPLLAVPLGLVGGSIARLVLLAWRREGK
jgi:hypothetical protein